MWNSNVCCLWHAAPNLNVSHRPHNNGNAYRWQSPAICPPRQEASNYLILHTTVTVLRESTRQLHSCCFVEMAEFCQRRRTGPVQLHELFLQRVWGCLPVVGPGVGMCSAKSVMELSGLQKYYNYINTSLKFIKVRTPPYVTSVHVFHSFLFQSHYMFRPIYMPSSGVIYKYNILKSYWLQRIRWFKVIITIYYAQCANCLLLF
jgi:hypothetical protein